MSATTVDLELATAVPSPALSGSPQLEQTSD